MDFNAAVDKFMRDVADATTEPCLLYRDNKGEWHCDHTQNQYGDTFDWVEDAKAADPFAVTITGEEFSRGSFPFVYDNVLRLRLCAEYNTNFVNRQDADQVHALLNFFEENVGEFSQDVTDHLADLDRPLDMLYRMDIPDLHSDVDDYDRDKTDEAIDAIEDRIALLIKRSEKDEVAAPEKRVIEGYAEKYCMEFAGKEVVIGENPSAEQPYFICNIRYDNLLGMEERYDGVISDDYVEIMREFVTRIDTLTSQLETERRESGLPVQVMTVNDCLPGSQNVDWIGKTLIIKPETLAPEFRSAESQYVLCKSGFGNGNIP